MSALIYAQGVAPILPIRRAEGSDRARVRLGRAVGARGGVASIAAGVDRHATWLGGDRYQEASELAFHLPAHPPAFAMNLSGRPNQYDLWPRFPDVARPGDNLLLAVDDGDEPHAAVKSARAVLRRSAQRRSRDAAARRGRDRHATIVGAGGLERASRCLRLPRPDAFEELDQRALLVVAERAHGDVVRVFHRDVERVEHGEAAVGDVAEHLAAIGRRALAAREAGRLELVEETRDARRLVDHAVANDERRQSGRARAAQDPQHVVLLHGDAALRDDLREVPLDERRRSENADGDFGLDRMEGASLRDLFLDSDRQDRRSRTTTSSSLRLPSSARGRPIISPSLHVRRC